MTQRKASDDDSISRCARWRRIHRKSRRCRKSLALVYAGTSDVPARAHLDGYLSIIEPTLTDAVGARYAAKIIDAMRAAVIGHKHELESRGSSRA